MAEGSDALVCNSDDLDSTAGPGPDDSAADCGRLITGLALSLLAWPRRRPGRVSVFAVSFPPLTNFLLP